MFLFLSFGDSIGAETGHGSSDQRANRYKHFSVLYGLSLKRVLENMHE